VVNWHAPKPASPKKIENKDLEQHVGNDVIGSASTVRDLGVVMDSGLSMKKHIDMQILPLSSATF